MEYRETDEWKPGDFIHYAGAVIDHQEVEAILETIESTNGRNWIAGPKAAEFEKKLGAITQSKYVTLANSGSSALLLAILALDLPPKSRIAIPATCFPTAYTSIIYAGHIPVVFDSFLSTFNLDEELLEEVLDTQCVDALIVELIGGNIPDLNNIKYLCEQNDVKVIVDNCDGLGGIYKYHPVESYGDVSVTSFNAAHIITTGEGGAVFTNDSKISKRVRQYRDWGREDGTDEATLHSLLPADYPKRYSYSVAGLNLKPLELQAAMGLVQLTKLNYFKKIRTENFEFLKKGIEEYDIPLTVVEVIPGADPCWIALPVICPDHYRSTVVEYLTRANIETRPIFAGNILDHPFVDKYEHVQCGYLYDSDSILKNGLFLPVSPRNSQDVYDYILETLRGLT